MVSLVGKTVTVLGAARSGIAVAPLLKNNGANVFVSDSAPAEKLTHECEVLNAHGIAYETGKHSERVYKCSLMVLSPGVPSTAQVVVEAQRRNIPVVSELEVASWFCKGPIIAITGSNGKTTTTTLVGEILNDARIKHVVAGNIGTAFSSVVHTVDKETLVVLEVSSFQLDHIQTFRPWISVILNITPDHMDRYEHRMELYAAAKARIFENQCDDDIIVYNVDDEWTRRVVQSARSQRVEFSTQGSVTRGAMLDGKTIRTILDGVPVDVLPINELGIRGMHNVYNVMAATLVARVIGIDLDTIRTTLRTFRGVEHRLEFVRELNGVQYYNDSKATNVDSVRFALQAFEEPIVLLLGGRDKGNDYTVLTELVRERVKAIVALGESAEKVENAFRGITVVKRATSMDEAVSVARFLAVPGDVVLLSPACASFDWFQNYEHRGKVFKELVQKL
ncbi:MAG: UDP-N-acetylmuramoyl-L-alanine--D-glutamate ligase [Bacteroidetes bacterium]|nr:UDP-N-acetylmuramoyl-L-alanine--D-glutamate ligase [Bacteroidota bacterium]